MYLSLLDLKHMVHNQASKNKLSISYGLFVFTGIVQPKKKKNCINLLTLMSFQNYMTSLLLLLFILVK